MRAFLSIVRRELSDTIASPLGQKIAVIHLILASVAVFVGWPISYPLSAARPAPTFALWVYAELIMVSYLSLAIPANALGIEGKIRSGEWIIYGGAPLWAVNASKVVATLLAIACWLLSVVPVMLIALALSPVDSSRLLILLRFSTLLVITLAQVGTWIGVTFDSQPFRAAAVDVTFILLMIGSLLVQTLSDALQTMVYVQPLEMAARILDVSAREAIISSAAGTLAGLSIAATPSTSSASDVPWTSCILLYGSLLATSCVLSLLSLKQWRARQSEEGERLGS